MDLTAKDAARMLNVPEAQVYAWIRNGTLPSYHVKDRYRLNRVELLEWATARDIKIDPEFFQDRKTNGKLVLTHALSRGGVLKDVACQDKPSALKAVCDLLTLPAPLDREDLYGVLIAREALCSTGIGRGVAIPHPRGPIVLGLSEPHVTLAFFAATGRLQSGGWSTGEHAVRDHQHHGPRSPDASEPPHVRVAGSEVSRVA